MVNEKIITIFDELAIYFKNLSNSYERTNNAQISIDVSPENSVQVLTKYIDELNEVFQLDFKQGLQWKRRDKFESIITELEEIQKYMLSRNVRSVVSPLEKDTIGKPVTKNADPYSIFADANKIYFKLARYYSNVDQVGGIGKEGSHDLKQMMQPNLIDELPAFSRKVKPIIFDESKIKSDTQTRNDALKYSIEDHLKGLVPREASLVKLDTLVSVMFATDRKISDSPEPRFFSDDRGIGSLNYGIADISIPATHKYGKLERPSIWKFEFSETKGKHILIKDCKTLEESNWLNAARERIDKADSKSALIFVHGFNVSFDDALMKAAQIGYDIQYNGLITAFSWGSKNKILDYMADEDSAIIAAPQFMEFLALLRDNLGLKSIQIIAHSMGNRVLVEALKSLGTQVQQSAAITEVVMAAPDIDANVFMMAFPKILSLAKRFTLYGSENDKALLASKKLRAGYPRAGDGGKNILVIKDLETIDVSAVADDFFELSHSYFSSVKSVVTDLYYIIRLSIPASKRARLEHSVKNSIDFWLIKA